MTDYAFESTPEDAWHPDDPIEELIDNLFARCALLDGGRRSPQHGSTPVRLAELMDELVERVLAKLKERLSLFDRVRADLILEDVELIRSKIRGS